MARNNASPVQSDSFGETQTNDVPSEAGRLAGAPELAFLNRHHTYALTAFQRSVDEATPASGLWAGLRCRVARRLGRFLRDAVLSGYVEAETEFQAYLVRHLNALSRVVDTRELRLDDQKWMSLHALEARMGEQIGVLRGDFQTRLGALERRVHEQEASFKTVESVVQGLERIVSGLGRERASATNGEDSPGENKEQGNAGGMPDYSYLLLENRYRGSEQEIEARLEQYAAVFPVKGFPESKNPVLEIGSGRGELQRIFRRHGTISYGIELDRAMVEHCSAQGLDVRFEDALSHLARLADSSLGGLIAVQVVEHLSPAQLRALFKLASRKVTAGGRVVFESINTESLLALSHNYFRDPTHSQPLHPDTLRHLMEMNGLIVLETRKLSPFPAEATFQCVDVPPYVTPRWAELLERMNQNVFLLNNLMFGYQDYCVIGEVP